ncbi:MAG: hypothetical protein IT547_18965 [Hyphomonadaceae bacterium]|nr:hypothetical protein [Hyphomonadaceae bacterium]
MLVRALLVMLVLCALISAALVFEAASKTASALDMIRSAKASQSPVVQSQILLRAETSLRESWARPTLWHAGAAEALSGAYMLDAEIRSDPQLYAESARWAEISLRRAPVQPHAWTRLALLSDAGYPNSLCDIAECLTKSWQAAAITDPETDCARLQLAHRHDLLLPQDPRISTYLRSGVSRRQAAQCLSFLEPDVLYDALMDTAGRAAQ